MYNLRVNWWYDERRDIVASTYAAGYYLRDLHGIWGDWFLALAAYNCVEYRVARQVARGRIPGAVRGVEADPQEEGLVLVGAGADPIHGVARDQVGRMPLTLATPLGPAHDRRVVRARRE